MKKEIDCNVHSICVARASSKIIYVKREGNLFQVIREGRVLFTHPVVQDEHLVRIGGDKHWFILNFEPNVLYLFDQRGIHRDKVDLREHMAVRRQQAVMTITFFSFQDIAFVLLTHRCSFGSLVAVSRGKILPVDLAFDPQMTDGYASEKSLFGAVPTVSKTKKTEFCAIFFGFCLFTKVTFRLE